MPATLFRGGEIVARYAISAEGAASMRALARQLYAEANAILEASTILETKVAAVGDGLGIYESELLGIIQQGRNTLKVNRDDILDLAQRVLQKADEIEELVALNWGATATAAVATGVIASNSTNGTSSLVPNRTAPRDLLASQYSFSKDSDGNMVYDSPNEMNQYLYKTQGSADAAFQGTCGLCSCANILRLAGVNASEAEMIAYASKTRDPNSFNGMLCATGYSDPGLNGGTSPKSRQQILEHFGIDSGIFPLSHEPDGSISDKTVSQIADYVSAGRGVILSVHADVLWNDASFGVEDYHAVTVTSVKKNSAGDVLGFYICDSANGGTTYYSAEKVKRALTGSPMNVTYPIIR